MTNTPLTAGILSQRLLTLPDQSVILIDGRIFAEKQNLSHSTEWATFDGILTDSTAELAERLELAGWDFVTLYTPDDGFTAQASDHLNGVTA